MDLENLNGPSHYGTLLLLQNTVAEFGTALARRLQTKEENVCGRGIEGRKESFIRPGTPRDGTGGE